MIQCDGGHAYPVGMWLLPGEGFDASDTEGWMKGCEEPFLRYDSDIDITQIGMRAVGVYKFAHTLPDTCASDKEYGHVESPPLLPWPFGPHVAGY